MKSRKREIIHRELMKIPDSRMCGDKDENKLKFKEFSNK